MSVVGDIVDMKVDGPTRIDFSEQVKNKMLEYFHLLSENILGLQKRGREENITSKSSSCVSLI